nr:hypothetical protein [Tanacetum cinerariifolium]
LEDEVVSLLKKEKENLKTIESLKSKGFELSENAISESENQSKNDYYVVENERDKAENSKVIAPGMFKLRETSSASVCNDAMNVSCNSRMCDLLNDNNFFIFDDESVKISPVSKMPFRKKPRDSMHMRSESNMNKYLPRTVHKWLSKMQPSVPADQLRSVPADQLRSVPADQVRSVPADQLRSLGSEYGEQDRKAVVSYEYETFKALEGELLLDTYIRYIQQNQEDVNDAMGLKKKIVVVTSDPLALTAEKTKVSKRKEKVVVSSDSEGESDEDDLSGLKKITALLAKAFNRKKFYSKPTNNNLRTSSASISANKKQEYVKSGDKKEEKKVEEKKRDMNKVKCYNCKKEGHFAKDCKKAKVKDYDYYKTKMLLAKKDKDEQVLLAEDHAWMESSSDYDQDINANKVFMAQIENVHSDSEASSSSADDKIVEVSYYTSESEIVSEYETLEYYDNST